MVPPARKKCETDLRPVPGQPIGADYNQTHPAGNQVKGKFGNFCRTTRRTTNWNHGGTETQKVRATTEEGAMEEKEQDQDRD